MISPKNLNNDTLEWEINELLGSNYSYHARNIRDAMLVLDEMKNRSWFSTIRIEKDGYDLEIFGRLDEKFERTIHFKFIGDNLPRVIAEAVWTVLSWHEMNK